MKALPYLFVFAAGVATVGLAQQLVAHLAPAPAVAELSLVATEELPESPTIEAPASETEELPESPTIEAPASKSEPFKMAVKVEVVPVPPTHGHLLPEVAACQGTATDDCYHNLLAKHGLNQEDGTVAVFGDTKQVFRAQLEPGGDWIENPDLNGNGWWDGEDEGMLRQALKGE